MKAYLQIVSVLCLVTALLVSCGPAPNPKLQANAAQPKEEVVKEGTPAAAHVVEAQPAPVVEAPAPQPAARPRREAPAKAVAARPALAPAPRPASASASNAPASTSENSGPRDRTLSLPAPIAPPLVEPAPPVDDVKREPEPPPAPQVVRVPSGTLVAVRMIDSVDSETARVGETFKASLDAPIIVDNETVFPEGSDVYVKLSKVQSAGRVSGKSEVQLELDRIFLGRKSYTLETSKYVETGASQAGRTAKTAGLGAAIGAAIGAIKGGGKGAVIGGATGAGAGAGVEAIRKGDQVRVESETRLEFRLEDSIEVTLESASPNSRQRNNPSGPRFGTRQ